MSRKVALVTGATGRDGAYLAEFPLADYRRWLEGRGAAGKLVISRLVGVKGDIEPPVGWARIDLESRHALESVSAIRTRLARRFQAETNEDIAVAGRALVVRELAASDR